MKRPHFDNAPGVVLKPRKHGFEARWQAPTDVVRRGYGLKSVPLWKGVAPTDAERQFVSKRAGELQQWMHDWAGLRIVKPATYDGMLHSLIACYTTDKVSTYHKLRHKTRENYDSLLKRLLEDRGSARIAELKVRHLKEWHIDWSSDGKIAMAHSLVGMLRTVIGFGATDLEEDDCIRVAVLLSKTKFKMPGRPDERMTLDQVEKLIAVAHQEGLHSIALAEAMKFDGIIRQKDAIGERVPLSDPNFPPTDVILGNEKWGRGARWEEVDAAFRFTHVTSKKDKPVVIPLRHAPLVMAEFDRIGPLPDKGPMIICEKTGEPWKAHEYRRQFRRLARLAGIPDNIKSMHTRAGAISEATEAGVDIEKIRQAATHSNSATTQRYSRADVENTADTLIERVAHRANRTGKSSRTE